MTETIRPGRVPDRRSIPRTASTEFSFKRFGGSVYKRRNVVTVGTSPIEIIPNNPDRVFYFIQNRAAVDGEVDWIQDFTTNQGLLLAANGGFVQQDVEEDGDSVTDKVYGSSAAASSSWFVYEIIRYRVRASGG